MILNGQNVQNTKNPESYQLFRQGPIPCHILQKCFKCGAFVFIHRENSDVVIFGFPMARHYWSDSDPENFVDAKIGRMRSRVHPHATFDGGQVTEKVWSYFVSLIPTGTPVLKCYSGGDFKDYSKIRHGTRYLC